MMDKEIGTKRSRIVWIMNIKTGKIHKPHTWYLKRSKKQAPNGKKLKHKCLTC